MAIFKFMIGNLKKRKSYSIVICILLFLAGLILTVTISTIQGADKAYDCAINNIKGPQLIYWPKEKKFKSEASEWLKKRSEVESVKLRNVEGVNGGAFKYKGKVLYDSGDNFMLQYNLKDKMRIIDGIHSSKKILSKGEVYLPYIFKTENGVAKGDKIDFIFGDNKLKFRVAGFVEEPISGGQLIGSKRFFVSKTDMNDFLKIAGKDAYCCQSMEVRLKNYNDIKSNEINKQFIKKYGSSVNYVNTYNSIKNGHLILPKIALIIMVTFAAFLCLITVIIIRYAILATIEADFLNIGIVKALGFTPSMVQAAISGQYVLLGLLSGILSLIVSAFVTPYFGQLILKSSGLYYSGRLLIGVSLFTLGLILLVTLMFSYLTARRTKKITPVRAIANGNSPVYFSSRFNLKLEHMGFIPFNTRMAVKQLLTKLKRYVFLVLISAILTFTLSSALGFSKFINSDKGLNTLGIELPDIELDTNTKHDAEKIIKNIKRDFDVKWVMYQRTKQLEVEDERTVVKIQQEFTSAGELTTLEGRYPKHNNEIAISNILNKKFNKGVGDYLSIKDVYGKSHEYIVSGIFQTVDEGGLMGRMLETGMKVLEPNFELNEAYIRLKNSKNINKIINEMKKKYKGYEEISNEKKETQEQVNAARSVFSAISKLFLILAVIIISFIILLIMKITIYGEIREIGIYKAVGFSSQRIQLQLAIRFVIVTAIGGTIGILLMLMFGAQLFSMALTSVGISNVELGANAANILFPVVLISALALVSAYFSSSNIKKVSTYELINE